MDDIEKIVDIQLHGLRERLEANHISLDLTQGAKEALALEGLDPLYGARPLKRLIQRQVVDNVASLVIDGKVSGGDTVRFDVNEHNEFFAEKTDAKEK